MAHNDKENLRQLFRDVLASEVSPQCPEIEKMEAMAEGRLKGKKKRELQAHLNECPSCASTISALWELLEFRRQCHNYPARAATNYEHQKMSTEQRWEFDHHLERCRRCRWWIWWVKVLERISCGSSNILERLRVATKFSWARHGVVYACLLLLMVMREVSTREERSTLSSKLGTLHAQLSSSKREKEEFRQQRDKMRVELNEQRIANAAHIEEVERYGQKKLIEEQRRRAQAKSSSPPTQVVRSFPDLTDRGGKLQILKRGNQVVVVKEVDPAFAAAMMEKNTQGTVSNSRIEDLLFRRILSEGRGKQRNRGESKTYAIVLQKPVATGIISTTPTLRWMAQGITEFDVEIQEVCEQGGRLDGIGPIIVKHSKNNELDIPTSEPLKLGSIYSWRVTAQGEKYKSPIGFFKVIDEKVLDAVREAQIKYADSYFLLGTFYESQGLYLDAIREFEQLAALNPNDDRVRRMLDALYIKLGWTELKEGNRHEERKVARVACGSRINSHPVQ